MENDTFATPPAERPRLPPASMPQPMPPRQAVEQQSAEHNGIFRSLVAEDSDIAGLVAYSIYKQNKLDWLGAFEAAKGRAPNEAELDSYIIGEGTSRRLATYRHLAEATLAGKGPDGTRRAARPTLADGGALSPGAILGYAVILAGLVAVFWIALRYTMSPR